MSAKTPPVESLLLAFMNVMENEKGERILHMNLAHRGGAKILEIPLPGTLRLNVKSRTTLSFEEEIGD